MHVFRLNSKHILFLILFLIANTNSILGQKRAITKEDYNDWNTISEQDLSTYGNFIVYIKKPLVGDPELNIYSRKADSTTSVIRAEDAKISHDESVVVFKQINSYDSTRTLKLEDVPKKKWPEDTVVIYYLKRDTSFVYPNSVSYNLEKDGGQIVAIKRGDKFKIPEAKDSKKDKKCTWFKKKEEPKPKLKFDGKFYTFFNTSLMLDTTFEGVSAIASNRFGNSWAIIQKATLNDSIDSVWVKKVGEDLQTKTLFKGQGDVQNFVWDQNGEQFAFLFSSDTGKVKQWNLMYSSLSNKMDTLIHADENLISDFYGISINKTPYFSKDGKRLFFGVSEREKETPKDTLTDDEKYSLDLWSWTDGRLQSQQLHELKQDQKRTDLWVYLLDQNTKWKMTDSTFERVSIPNNKDANYALLASQYPYLKEMTWDGWYYDYYRMNLKTGQKDKVLTHFNMPVELSPSGEKLVYYSSKDSLWHLRDLANNFEKKLFVDDVNFFRKYHDTPDQVGPVGQPFWLVNEDAVVVKAQYDYWVFPISGGKPYRMTNGKERLETYELIEFDREKYYYSLQEPIYFKTFNYRTKKEGVAVYGTNGIEQIFEDELKIYMVEKADSSNVVAMREMSVNHYPDIELTTTEFKNRKLISKVNPQQENLNWATVELFSWKDYNNDSVSGLLYKPENFDPSKKYPMIVYYYERYTDNIHYFYSPKPTASIVYPTEYASNGYIVFVPDISYEIGHPAKGAYNVVMSGVDNLLKQNAFIDSTKMGLQGQSWGGYQTAQLITMTNRFAAAMAGAPVSNMFSAYGGIRWGSGHNRAFQYEKGQSRIGATIWEAPELYIENSPIFHVPNVETPLLIMHNDNDGAVPWYQGIELFTALRRLDKPVWMLTYNKDQHNLRNMANKRDLSIRMRQFFDYYLLEQPLPVWMKSGIPALEKGAKTGYEFAE